MSIPVIDFSAFRNGSIEERQEISYKIGNACVDIGFFVIKNHGLDQKIIDDAWNTIEKFFDLPLAEKQRIELNQDEYPYGFNSMGTEVLSAGKATESNTISTNLPDLKEMFSVGPCNPQAGMPERIWPQNPEDFAEKCSKYYDALTELATQILQAFAITLNLPENYFEQYTDHHASALRALNYPNIDGYEAEPGQLRASAHTDYGMITILRSGGPGLQVSKDRDPPTWIDVPFIENGFIINLGDLMRRWTNDNWQSTLHRVIVPPPGSSWGRRQSIAFFYNLNKDALVESLFKDKESSKYPPIIAGDFLMQKHLASMKAI